MSEEDRKLVAIANDPGFQQVSDLIECASEASKENLDIPVDKESYSIEISKNQETATYKRVFTFPSSSYDFTCTVTERRSDDRKVTIDVKKR